VCRPGGVWRDLDCEQIRDATDTLTGVEAEFQRFVALLERTSSFQERLAGTGIVPTPAARDLGAVGVAARASGIPCDARWDQPRVGYAEHRLPVAVRTAGDVQARAEVRIEEVRGSLSLARALLADLPSGPLATPIASLPPYRVGIGVTESPRGANVHWLRTGPAGRIDRYRIRSASYCNWPIVALAVPGNMVPDFPLINKSFELCYACLDR
jgi:Ni,Fe-hydrogenase III large subunit